jgi:hypothetical protein
MGLFLHPAMLVAVWVRLRRDEWTIIAGGTGRTKTPCRFTRSSNPWTRKARGALQRDPEIEVRQPRNENQSSQIPQLLLLPLCARTIFGPLPAQEQAPVLCPLFHFGTKFHQHGDKAAVLIVQKSSETFDA